MLDDLRNNLYSISLALDLISELEIAEEDRRTCRALLQVKKQLQELYDHFDSKLLKVERRLAKPKISCQSEIQ